MVHNETQKNVNDVISLVDLTRFQNGVGRLWNFKLGFGFGIGFDVVEIRKNPQSLHILHFIRPVRTQPPALHSSAPFKMAAFHLEKCASCCYTLNKRQRL